MAAELLLLFYHYMGKISDITNRQCYVNLVWGYLVISTTISKKAV